MSIGLETLTTGSQSNSKGTGIAKESGHWYYPDGRPCYTITGKNGKERSPFLKEAISMSLVPGVTTITGQVRKYGLEIYGKKQTALSALTMPRKQGETDEAFVDRIITESGEHAGLAAEKGTECHEALENYLWGRTTPTWDKLSEKVITTLWQYGIDAYKGKPEHSFASTLGYGGKTDLVIDELPLVCDFKTKAIVKGVKQLAWPEHCWQLAAYAKGLNLNKARLVNVFIGIEDQEVLIHEWNEKDAEQGWQAFQALLSFWQITKNYTP